MDRTGESSSPLEDSGRYDDDDFEEQEKLVVGQVHPLLAALDDASKLEVNALELETTKTSFGAGDDDEHDDEDDQYDTNDDDFEKSQTSVSELKIEEASESEPTLLSVIETTSVFASGAEPDYRIATTDHNGIDERSHEAHQPEPPVRDEAELVRIHAHRGEETTLTLPPPPAPLRDLNLIRETEQCLQRLCLSEQRAVVAAKRITEYRENQRQIAAEKAAEVAKLKKQREQFRSSNRKSYARMGVTNRTREQRYADLLEEKKLLMQHEKACQALEKNQRWYNRKRVQAEKQHRQTPAHATQLQARYTDAFKERQRIAGEQAKIIKSRQADLHKRALAIASRCTRTEYTKGSYLLSRKIGDSSSALLSPSHLQGEPPVSSPPLFEQETRDVKQQEGC